MLPIVTEVFQTELLAVRGFGDFLLQNKISWPIFTILQEAHRTTVNRLVPCTSNAHALETTLMPIELVVLSPFTHLS